MGTGQTAPNPAQETVDFDTAALSLRYGLTERLNLLATLPWFSIESSKIQGAPYTRTNKGIGDLSLEVEYSLLNAPQLTLDLGVKLATGSVDKTDALGQRICDILALGSGTTDFLLGSSLWVPHVGIEHLDLISSVQHRFVGGMNKWGYQFGDQTTFRVHADYPLIEKGRVGLLVEGFHTGKDTWYGNVVPERGATFVYVGPSVSYNLTDTLNLGAFLRLPLYMDLQGSQMVAPATLGFDVTSNITDFMHALLAPLGVEE